MKPEVIDSLAQRISTDRDLQWRATDIGSAFYMDSSARSEQIKGAHCAACAYADVITKYGGDVDLRGLSRYGPCYEFLAVLVRQERETRQKKTG